MPKAKKDRARKGDGRLYKRDSTGAEHPADWKGNGAYWLAYVVPNPEAGTGKRMRVPLKDANGEPITERAEAEAERRRIVAPYVAQDAVEAQRQILARLQSAEQRLDAAIEAAAPTVSIVDTWRAYLAALGRPDSGERTLKQYVGHWKRFQEWLATAHPNTIQLREVTPQMGTEYADNLHVAGLSPNRFNKHVVFLRCLFRVLADTAHVLSNPFDGIRKKALRTHSRRELTIAELTLTLRTATGDLALLMLLGACTGLRLGDCATLEWGEVDLLRGIIRRIPNKTAKNGKPVLLGIPPALLTRLSEISTEARKGYVLPAMARDYLRDPSTITDAVRKHVLACGIDVHAPGTGTRIVRMSDGTPKRDEKTGKLITEDTGKPAVVEVGFHSLRHTWVSMHAAHGTPASVIQASVGHASPAMTAHYTHVNEATARTVALALPAFGGATSPKRDPLPPWAREIIEKQNPDKITAAAWKATRAELLKGGAR
jgi:integrase